VVPARVPALLLFLLPLHARGDECPIIPPVPKVQAQNIYADESGSVALRGIEENNRKLTANITAMLQQLHATFDRPSSSRQKQCAADLLDRWAKGGALLQAPETATARVERVLLALAINIAILKQKSSGYDVTANELAWTQQLTEAVESDYGADALVGTRYYRNNTFFWTGAVFAVHAVVTGQELDRRKAFRAWRQAIARIDNQGYLPAELQRGSRALIYHQFSLSALLITRSAIQALGGTASREEKDALQRLAATIGKALCDATDLSRLAGSKTQEAPGEWGFRVSSVFAHDLTDSNWTTCGKTNVSNVDIKLGGDLEQTKRALEHSHTAD